MAIIPLDVGNATANPVAAQRVPEGAFGGQVFETIGGIAGGFARQASMQIAQEQQREEARRERIAQAAAEAKRMSATLGAQDGLDDLSKEFSDSIRSGKMPFADADRKFRERGMQLLEQAKRDMPDGPENEIAVVQLQRRLERHGNVLRDAGTEFDQRTTRAGLDRTLEHASRLYRTNPAQAQAMVDGAFEQFGPATGLMPDQLGKLKQSWQEQTQFTTAFEMVSNARNDAKALGAARKSIEGLPDLDPQKKATLLDRVSAYELHLKQQAEIAAQRAQRQAEAAMRKAEASFKSAQDLAMVGALDPAFADRMLKDMAGTPYAASFRQLLDHQQKAGPIAAQGVGAIRQTLDTINNRLATGATPELKQQRDMLERIADAQDKAIRTDGLLRAATSFGVVREELPPLDFAGGIPGIAAQVARRRPAAEAAALWARDRAGNAPPPELLYPQEALRVKEMLDRLPVKERSQALAVLSSQLGADAAAGLGRQFERLTQGASIAERAAGYALQMGASETTGNRLRGELVLRGAEAMKTGASTKVEAPAFGVKPSAWESTINAQLSGLPDPTSRRQVAEAALLIAHGISAEQGGKLDARDLERSVRLALGAGEMIPRGVPTMQDGRESPTLIPLPAGRTERDLMKTIEAIKPADIGAPEVVVSGERMKAEDFVTRVLPRAALVPVRPGVYAPVVGGRSVLRPDGSRYTFEVR
jgi:hypothetical protein